MLLRHDNADLRLTEIGREFGLVDDVRWERFLDRKGRIDLLSERLASTRVAGETLAQILRRPPTTWADLIALDPSLTAVADSSGVIEQVTIEAKYGGYIDRQAEQVARFRRLEHKPLPENLDYSRIPQLRAEAREKFQTVRPISLGQAGRISGISPADIATLLVHLKRSSSHPPDSPGLRQPRKSTESSIPTKPLFPL